MANESNGEDDEVEATALLVPPSSSKDDSDTDRSDKGGEQGKSPDRTELYSTGGGKGKNRKKRRNRKNKSGCKTEEVAKVDDKHELEKELKCVEHVSRSHRLSYFVYKLYFYYTEYFLCACNFFHVRQFFTSDNNL